MEQRIYDKENQKKKRANSNSNEAEPFKKESTKIAVDSHELRSMTEELVLVDIIKLN